METQTIYGDRRGSDFYITGTYPDIDAAEKDKSLPFGAYIMIENSPKKTTDGDIYRKTGNGFEKAGNIIGPMINFEDKIDLTVLNPKDIRGDAATLSVNEEDELKRKINIQFHRPANNTFDMAFTSLNPNGTASATLTPTTDENGDVKNTLALEIPKGASVLIDPNVKINTQIFAYNKALEAIDKVKVTYSTTTEGDQKITRFDFPVMSGKPGDSIKLSNDFSITVNAIDSNEIGSGEPTWHAEIPEVGGPETRYLDKITFNIPKGEKGDTGNGISSIVLSEDKKSLNIGMTDGSASEIEILALSDAKNAAEAAAASATAAENAATSATNSATLVANSITEALFILEETGAILTVGNYNEKFPE